MVEGFGLSFRVDVAVEVEAVTICGSKALI
jgi:hypothetical protein